MKTILVDDHELVLEGIAAMLENVEYIRIVGKAPSGEEAINMCDEKKPDIVLMDIIMRGMDGIEAAQWIMGYNKNIKIILLSSEVNEDLIMRAMQVGVHGYLPKDVKKSVLLEAMVQVRKGEKYFAKPVTNIIVDTYHKRQLSKESGKKTTLTKRENEILKHVAQGKKNHEVAQDLSISVKTVEVHKSNIMSKLELKSTTDMVLYAVKNKMVEL